MAHRSPSSTAFILVPGGFCPGSYFHKVTDKLISLGYTAVAIDLPSVGERDAGPTSMTDDTEHVRSVAASLADQGKDVVLVGNSYGGFITTEAAKGLGKPERNTEGKVGGLVHLVYISSLLAPVGVNVYELVGAEVPVSTESELSYIPPLDAAVGGAAICSDFAEDQQRYYGRLMKCHSVKAMAGRLTYAGYEDVPTTVVIPTRDKALNTQF